MTSTRKAAPKSQRYPYRNERWLLCCRRRPHRAVEKVAVASILASPNRPALGAQRSLDMQTAFVVRGAYFRPGNDARMRARATPRPHAPLRGASAPGVQTGKS